MISEMKKEDTSGWYVELCQHPRLVMEQAKGRYDNDSLSALAQALFYQNRLQELKKVLHRLASKGGRYKRFSSALEAQVELRCNKEEKALEILNSLQSGRDDSAGWARLVIAELLARRGELKRAENILRSPTGLEPDLMPRIVEAKLMFRKGLVAQAAEVLLDATTIFHEAPQPLRAAAQRNLAIYLGLSGDVPRALMHHQQALEEFKSLGDEYSLIKEYLSLGQTFLEGGEMDHAEFFFQKAGESIERFRCDMLKPLLASRMGMLRLRRGDIQGAKEYFQDDLDQSTIAENLFGQAFAHRNLGRILLREKDKHSALFHLEKSMKIFEHLGDELNCRLSALEIASASLYDAGRNDLNRAERIFMECRRFFQERHRDDFLSLVHLGRSRLFALQGRAELALEEFDLASRSLEERRRHDRLLEGALALADAFAEKGRTKPALDQLKRARRLAIEAGQNQLAAEILKQIGDLDLNALFLETPDAVVPEMSGDEVMGEYLLSTRSTAFKKVMDDARRVASTDEVVLLLGETGTGKEMLARYLHSNSRRRAKPFYPINCGAMTENLLESEFFGHEKGAFTGAHEARAGIFESADGGTVFLDEVGDLSQHGQAALLRVLEERRVRPIGSNVFRSVDVRILSATSRPLEEAVETNEFRSDLFYRLAVIVIELPPLRDRKEDIPALAEFMLRRNAVAQEKGIAGFRPDAMEMLLQYHWPGNLRELENAVRSACVRCGSKTIEPGDLPLAVKRCISRNNRVRANELVPLAEQKFLQVQKALEKTGGNITKAAAILGVHRNTVANILKKHRSNGHGRN